MSSSTQRLVVVGADAAGMSAAYQARRTARAAGRDLAITVLESTGHTSYSACGIPYWVAGDVAEMSDLVARGADEHRAAGIDLRLGTTATALDLDGGTVADDRGGVHRFDDVVLATGAEPVVPDWARTARGSLVPGVLLAKTLDDGAAWLDLLTRAGAGSAGSRRPARAVVVGGGYIGLEMAEALLRRGLETTLLTRHEVMSTLDPDLGAQLRKQLVAAGVRVVTGADVDGLDADGGSSVGGTGDGGTTSAGGTSEGRGRVRCVSVGGEEYPTDVVCLATGVRPRTSLGAAAGLPLGRFGGYLPDDRQRLAEGVWAAGDCVESETRLHPGRAFVPLGTHANKQGRVAGENLAGGVARFGGVLGTAVTRFAVGDVHVEIGRTGPTSAQLDATGVDYISLATESSTASGYMPEATPVTVKVVAEGSGRHRGRLLGVQLLGGPGSAKRVDTVAAAMWLGATVHDVAGMDLSYAPPLSPTWDPVQIACRRLADRL